MSRTLLKATFVAGTVAAIALTVIALNGGSPSAQAGEATPTVASGSATAAASPTTAAATTPTASTGAGTSTPAAATTPSTAPTTAALPATGSGGATDGGGVSYMLLAAMAIAVAGLSGLFLVAGRQR